MYQNLFQNFIKSSSGGRANMNDVEQVWNIIEKYKADKEKSKIKNNLESCQNGSGTSEEKLLNNSNDKTQANGEDQIIEGNNKKINKKKKQKDEINVNTELIDQTNEADISNRENLKKSKKKKKQLKDNETLLEPEKMDTNISGSNDICNKNKPKKKKIQVEEAEENSNVKKPKLEQLKTDEPFDFVQKILDVLASKGSISKNKLEKKVISAYLKHSGLSESSPKLLKKFNKKLKKIDNIETVDDTITLKT